MEATHEKRPRESILRAEFSNAIESINKDLSEENHLKFLHWDLNKHSRSKATNVLLLLGKLAAYALTLTGFFYCQITPALISEGRLKCPYFEQNVSASGARPNPQGSFHYGFIKVTDTYVLKSVPPMMVDGKLRATLNGISFVNPDTPVRLADKYNVKGSYKLDFPSMPLNRPPRTDRSLINATYKGFIEIILQNNDTVVQSFHMDGYSFFVVGMAYGEWTENSKGSYNNWDAISRSTTQVFPGGWTAVLVSLDNVGVWNLRAENLDRWYLGQETYMRIINPEPDPSNKTEFPMPDNALFCGALSHLQKPRKGSSSAVPTIRGQSKLYVLLVAAFCAVISELL